MLFRTPAEVFQTSRLWQNYIDLRTQEKNLIKLHENQQL